MPINDGVSVAKPLFSGLTKAMGVGGMLMNSASGIIGSILQNRANKKMAEYSYTKDLEMWNRQNEYNSPKAQMERLRAAGLNPNLVYGSGNTTGNVAGQMPKYQAPNMEMNIKGPDMGSYLSMLDQYVNLQTNIANMKTANREADLKTIDVQIKNAAKDAIIDNYFGKNSILSADLRNKQNQALMYQDQVKNLNLRNMSIALDNKLKQSGGNSTDTFLIRSVIMNAIGQMSTGDMFPYMLGEYVGDAGKRLIPQIGNFKIGGKFNPNAGNKFQTNQPFTPLKPRQVTKIIYGD